MSSFTKSFKSGKHILCVWSTGPSEALEQLDRHLRTNLINADDYVRAILCYNGTPSEDSKNPANYALKVYSKYRREELWISGLETGSRRPAAQATLQCLMLLGFDVNPEKDVYGLPIGEKHTFVKTIKK